MFWFPYFFVALLAIMPLAWWIDRRRARIKEPVGFEREQAARRRLSNVSPFSPYFRFLAVVSLLGLAPFLLMSGANPCVVLGLAYPLYILLLFVGYRYTQQRRRDVLGRIETEHNLICPECHYSLRAHADGGRCPECGYVFTPESIAADWADIVELAKRRRG